jgi:hypothetical protein
MTARESRKDCIVEIFIQVTYVSKILISFHCIFVLAHTLPVFLDNDYSTLPDGLDNDYARGEPEPVSAAAAAAAIPLIKICTFNIIKVIKTI